MSEWVHVNGYIRVDSLDLREKESSLSIGIVYEIYKNPEFCCNAAYILPFIPNFNVYEDVEKIKQWFINVLK